MQFSDPAVYPFLILWSYYTHFSSHPSHGNHQIKLLGLEFSFPSFFVFFFFCFFVFKQYLQLCFSISIPQALLCLKIRKKIVMEINGIKQEKILIYRCIFAYTNSCIRETLDRKRLWCCSSLNIYFQRYGTFKLGFSFQHEAQKCFNWEIKS